MNLPFRTSFYYPFLFIFFASFCGCFWEQSNHSKDEYFEKLNQLHNGNYFGTYPLQNPDSSIIKLKAEVPEQYQPWGCMAIWYRMSRNDMSASFRMLDLYELNYPHDTVRTFTQIKRAEFLVDAAQFERADSCLQEVEEISLRLGRTLDLGDAYFLKGRIEMYRNNFSEARQALFKYLELLDSQDTTFSQAHALAYHSIAISYERAKQYDKMQEWLDKLWPALNRQTDTTWVPNFKAQTAILTGIGKLPSRPDSSLVWAKIAKQIVLEDLEIDAPAQLTYLFGRSFAELKHCDSSLLYLKDAYQKRGNSKNAFIYYRYPMALGQAYLCLNQLDSAYFFLQESLSNPDTGNLSVTHTLLSDLYEKKGELKKANEHLKTSMNLLLAKFTSDRINAAAETDARYEALEQSKKVDVLKKEAQISRMKIWLFILLFVLFSVVAAALYFRQQRRQKIMEQQKLLLENEKELALLRVQRVENELEHSRLQLLETKDNLDEASALLEFKNEIIKTLELRLLQHRASENTESSDSEDIEKHFSEMRILTKEDWNIFLESFSVRFPNFLNKLKTQHPTLTVAETRHILLIRLGFESPQIAEMLGIADNSVWRSRNRLVKSLGLETAKILDSYIREL